MKEELFLVDDVKKLYAAFISLCDYIENDMNCGKCPLYHTLCGAEDKSAVNSFGDSLARIRSIANIQRM